MGDGQIERRGKRKEFYCEIQVRFPGQVNFTALAVKDISATGLRVISPRLVKPGDSLEVKMCLIGRDIYCRAKVVWALLLRPSLGSVSSFDLGVEFFEMNIQDKEFLEKLSQR